AGSTLLLTAIALSPSILTCTHEGSRDGRSCVRQHACHLVKLVHHLRGRSCRYAQAGPTATSSANTFSLPTENARSLRQQPRFHMSSTGRLPDPRTSPPYVGVGQGCCSL